MRREIVKFLSLFIKGKRNQQKFREKHDPLERLKRTVTNIGCDYNYFKTFAHKKYVRRSNISFSFGVESTEIETYKEHLGNIQQLKNNLSEEALKHLETILNKSDKIEYSPLFIPEHLYNAEELELFYKSQDMQKEVEKIDDYYQYKNYKLPINCFEPSVFFYEHGINAIKTKDKLDNDAVIIDAGANILDSALVFRKNFPNNKIISFEPVKDTWELGQKTKNLNKLENVVYENLGLGDKSETCKIFLREHSYSNTMIENEDFKYIYCQNITLDEYVKNHNLKVGIIKTDVEGFEPQLLKGAINTIKEQKPILLISIYHNYNDFYKIKPWIEDLNLGYKFDFFKGIDRSPISETLLIGEIY